MTVGGLRISGVLEVFDSGGGWTLLFGKPLQAALGAVHDMRADVVTLNVVGRTVVLENRNPVVWRNAINAAAMAARRSASTGVKSCAIPPARRVHSKPYTRNSHPHPARGDATAMAPRDERREASSGVKLCATLPAR
jgi:hypothetical protein